MEINLQSSITDATAILYPHEYVKVEGILMSCYRAERLNEAVQRLKLVIYYALFHGNALMLKKMEKPEELGVVQLHVHKGELQVTWIDISHYEQHREAMQRAWSAACGGTMEHCMAGNPCNGHTVLV